jgi:RluA family pseudouridine synthase
LKSRGVIELGNGEEIPILYEDRSVIAIDKPAGWLLVPGTWQRTQRNLQTAIQSAIGARQFWARSRNITFLRYVHRLDAETSGVLLFGKSPGAVRSYGELFESREMEKMYLAIIDGAPAKNEWACRASIGEESSSPKRMKVDERRGKPAETHFKVLAVANGRALIEAQPVTGRTHQIRVHLAQSGNPVVGDVLYGKRRAEDSAPYPARTDYPLALRSILLAYRDPFTGRRVQIKAPVDEFLKTYNFSANETGFSEWMK